MKRYLNWIVATVILAGLFSCNQTEYKEPTVQIKTIFGKIDIELYPEKAPRSVEAFLANVKSGVYKQSNFYRVLKAEDQVSSADKSNLIQGGIYLSNPALNKQHPEVPLERTNETGLLHEDGTISFARGNSNSSGTEFFICLGKLPSYDFGGNGNPDKQGFAAFGSVIKGMDVVERIHRQASNGTTFTPPLLIKNIVYLGPDK